MCVVLLDCSSKSRRACNESKRKSSFSTMDKNAGRSISNAAVRKTKSGPRESKATWSQHTILPSSMGSQCIQFSFLLRSHFEDWITTSIYNHFAYRSLISLRFANASSSVLCGVYCFLWFTFSCWSSHSRSFLFLKRASMSGALFFLRICTCKGIRIAG